MSHGNLDGNSIHLTLHQPHGNDQLSRSTSSSSFALCSNTVHHQANQTQCNNSQLAKTRSTEAKSTSRRNKTSLVKSVNRKKFKSETNSSTESASEPTGGSKKSRRSSSWINSLRRMHRTRPVQDSDNLSAGIDSTGSLTSHSLNEVMSSTNVPSDVGGENILNLVVDGVAPSLSGSNVTNRTLPHLTVTLPVEEDEEAVDMNHNTDRSDSKKKKNHSLGDLHWRLAELGRRHSHRFSSPLSSTKGDYHPGQRTLTSDDELSGRLGESYCSHSGWNIYPPTRTRNASCSGIDNLADAILRTKSIGVQGCLYSAEYK